MEYVEPTTVMELSAHAARVKPVPRTTNTVSKPLPFTAFSPIITRLRLRPRLFSSLHYIHTRHVYLSDGGKNSKGASLKFSAKILDNFAYEFDRGDRIGIVGGNGVGKTTFLNVLMGTQPLDSGEVKTGGTVR